MDLFDVVKVAVKRWWVVLPIVMVAVFIAYQSYSSVKPVYYTSVSVGLVTPSVKEQQPIVSGEPVFTTSNGLTEAGGISLLSNLLALSMKDGAVRSQVRALGGTAAYDTSVFTLPNTGQLPIVVVSASGPSKDSVEATVTLVAQQASPVLENVQAGAGVPQQQMVTAFPLSDVPDAYGAIPGRTREAGAVIIGGVLIALLCAVMADAILMRVRSRNRSGEQIDANPARLESQVHDLQYHVERDGRHVQNGSHDEPRSLR